MKKKVLSNTIGNLEAKIKEMNDEKIDQKNKIKTLGSEVFLRFFCRKLKKKIYTKGQKSQDQKPRNGE